MTTTATAHIVLDDRGRPWIEGTNTKVIEVVMDKIGFGWTPEEIHQNHPHLPLSKIYAAFSYYYDHQAELDWEMQRQVRELEGLRNRVALRPAAPTRRCRRLRPRTRRSTRTRTRPTPTAGWRCRWSTPSGVRSAPTRSRRW